MSPEMDHEKRNGAGEEPIASPRGTAVMGRLRVVHDATRTRSTADRDDAGAPTPYKPQKTSLSDWSALMALAQDGDGVAYKRLLTEITPYLRSLANRHLTEPTAIEDAVQDSLLTIHRLRRTYDPRRPFGPWLATIAKRRSIDRFRRDARQRARETELTPVHETFVDDDTNRQAEHVDHRALHEAVDALPPGQREAIRLLKFGEMTLAEASQVSGKSVSALKVATHRALKSLMKTFARTEK